MKAVICDLCFVCCFFGDVCLIKCVNLKPVVVSFDEYDIDCLEWKFIEIENGFHLNCFPESIIINNLEILKKMKDL